MMPEDGPENTWKTTSGVNVFAMNDSHFLFEMPSNKSSRAGAVRRVGMEEDEIAGEMVEANDVVLASRNSARLGMIRLLGLPLNL